MTAIALCMLLCAGGFAGLATRRPDRAVFDLVAGLLLIGALSLIGFALGRALPF